MGMGTGKDKIPIIRILIIITGTILFISIFIFIMKPVVNQIMEMSAGVDISLPIPTQFIINIDRQMVFFLIIEFAIVFVLLIIMYRKIIKSKK